ncbi:MAG: N-acetyltransferase [Pseudomonadota bacterium]
MSDAGLGVRKATAADADALAAIGGESFLAAYGGIADSATISEHVAEAFSPRTIRREMRREDCEYLLAATGGVAAGLAKLRWDSLPDDKPMPDPVEVQQLYVHSDWQRAGAGRALLDAVVLRARQRGYKTLWLQVWSQADWAVAFYEAYGMRRSGELSFYLGARRYDDWLMSLSL